MLAGALKWTTGSYKLSPRSHISVIVLTCLFCARGMETQNRMSRSDAVNILIPYLHCGVKGKILCSQQRATRSVT